jgi:hypothetical protein
MSVDLHGFTFSANEPEILEFLVAFPNLNAKGILKLHPSLALTLCVLQALGSVGTSAGVVGDEELELHGGLSLLD